MTEFKAHTIESAPEASKKLLGDAKSAYGFVPNPLADMAESPALLEGYMTLSGIFGKTNLSETERQIILMVNNRLNDCAYCMAAHTSIAQMAGVDAGVIEALRNDTPIADTKLEALRSFSIVMHETQGRPTQGQVQAFIDAGYTQQNILEVIVGMSLKLMSNYTTSVVETVLDDAFAANTWSPEKASAA